MEEKKDWKEELQDIINREMFKEDLMIQIKSLVEQELDKAREEEFEKGKIAGRLEALPITIEEVNKARKGAKKEESKKLCQSISKELYKLYSDIEYSGDLRDEVYNLSDKYEKLSKLKTKEDEK